MVLHTQEHQADPSLLPTDHGGTAATQYYIVRRDAMSCPDSYETIEINDLSTPSR